MAIRLAASLRAPKASAGNYAYLDIPVRRSMIQADL